MAPKLDPKALSEEYGFSYAFLRSDPSLYSLFQQAVSGSWTADKFTTELKQTPWYRKNGETVRQYNYQLANDPATVAQKKNAVLAQLRDASRQMGAAITENGLSRLADNALKFGWNDAQTRDQLSSFVKVQNGVYLGDAGTAADQIRQSAWRNGVKLPTGTIDKWVGAISAGSLTAEAAQNQIREMAKAVAPAYAKQLDTGMDLYDVASPYIQSMSKDLELNPADVDLFDPTIRKALNTVDTNGTPTSVPLWRFEQQVKQDPRYLKTQGAQDSFVSTGKKVLQDMGFVS